MAEENTTTTEPTATTEGNEGAAKTFTQEQVDEIVKKRVARVKATVPDDYDELKKKAAAFDEAEEARKDELTKATEKNEKLQKELDDLKAAKQRADEVAAMAAQYKVDSDLLARMAGDVEDNTKFLAESKIGRSKYPSVSDAGEVKPAQLTAADINGIKDTKERIRARAAHPELFRK